MKDILKIIILNCILVSMIILPVQSEPLVFEDFTTAWAPMTESAEWSARYLHTSVAMPDGSIVLMGGSSEGNLKNDVWKSVNYGTTWAPMTINAEWSARYHHTSVVMPDGSIVLMGGSTIGLPLMNDVWQSVDYGESWTPITLNAEWSGRYGHSSVAMPDGSIVLMGGYDGDNLLANDVWRSIDSGKTWLQENGSAGWSARYGHCSVVMPDGSILLIGGSAIDGYKNDVWRSMDKGKTWMLMTANAGWSARFGHTSVSMQDGSIIIMGGLDQSGQKNDVWQSADYGTTWTPITMSAEWSARYLHTSVTIPDNGIVLTGGISGGSFKNDVWRFNKAVEKPHVESFKVDFQTGPPEQKFNIEYTVVASQGAQLTQVELWQKFNDEEWKQIILIPVSGTTNSGSFEVTPGIPGTYQYGIHVVDTKDWADQLPLSPIQVIVNPPAIKLDSGYYFPLGTFNEDPWGRWLSDQDEGYSSKYYHCGVDLIPDPNPNTLVGRLSSTSYPVYSIAEGQFLRMSSGWGYDRFGNPLYGVYIKGQTNEEKKFTTIYGHLKNVPLTIQNLKADDNIPAGSLLGFTSECCGSSTCCGSFGGSWMCNHLHLSISPQGCDLLGIDKTTRPNGVDPMDWLRNTKPSSEPSVSDPPIVVSDFKIAQKGNTFSGKMTITNIGNEDILLKELLIGGRDKTDSSENPEGRLPDGNFPDFPSDYNVLIKSGTSYIYSHTYQLKHSGDFEFFPYYQPFYGESRWILFDENDNFVKHYFFANCKYKTK